METKMFISVDPTACTGCRACELACSLSHAGECRPSRSNIHIAKREYRGINVPVLCMQCSDAPCVKVCPKRALYQDDMSGAVLLKEENCIGCKICHTACPLGAIHFPAESKKAAKCDLCGGNPQCVKFCETKALQFLPADNYSQPKSAKIVEAYAATKAPARKASSAGEIRI